MDYAVVGGKQILNLHKLEELRLDAYENVMLYKGQTKKWHDKWISKKEFT